MCRMACGLSFGWITGFSPLLFCRCLLFPFPLNCALSRFAISSLLLPGGIFPGCNLCYLLRSSGNWLGFPSPVRPPKLLILRSGPFTPPAVSPPPHSVIICWARFLLTLSAGSAFGASVAPRELPFASGRCSITPYLLPNFFGSTASSPHRRVLAVCRTPRRSCMFCGIVRLLNWFGAFSYPGLPGLLPLPPLMLFDGSSLAWGRLGFPAGTMFLDRLFILFGSTIQLVYTMLLIFWRTLMP